MKNPRFEIHLIPAKLIEEVGIFTIPAHYQWYLKHSNRKTLATGRPRGFRSIKGCKDALKLVQKILNPEQKYVIETEIFYKDYAKC